jgi:hypothetical protein
MRIKWHQPVSSCQLLVASCWLRRSEPAIHKPGNVHDVPYVHFPIHVNAANIERASAEFTKAISGPGCRRPWGGEAFAFFNSILELSHSYDVSAQVPDEVYPCPPRGGATCPYGGRTLPLWGGPK